jgi:hypothetical protein
MSTLKATNLQNASAASPAFVLAADGSATANLSSVNGGPIAGTRNRIINGDMRIDQRNAGAVTTGGSFPVDRFAMQTGGLNDQLVFSAQQSTDAPAGFTNSLLVTVTTAETAWEDAELFTVRQLIEGYNVADLGWGTASARPVTLSFWVKSSVTGTLGGAFRNSSIDRSYAFTYSVLSANTWEYKTVTIEGDTTGTWLTDNGAGIQVHFGLGAGPNRTGTAGSWQADTFLAATGQVFVGSTTGATFQITGVQLEPGSTATPFERRSYGQELALCQRYYQVFGDLNLTISGRSTNAATTVMPIVFRTTMRTAPTVAGTLTVGSGLSFSSTIDTMRVIGTADGNGTFVVSNSTASAEL